jgi:hypothetical protein
MEQIRKAFELRVNTASDIYQHLQTLREYASECDTVLELGVRRCVSSWAFALGLCEAATAASTNKKLIVCDAAVCDTSELLTALTDAGIAFESHWQNDLTLALKAPVDMTFIDTWHVYGQLRRELAHFAPFTRRYIVMHDTTVDGIHGETVRNSHKYDAAAQSRESGIPVEEILRGLEPAIEEFLAAHPEWTLHARWTHNNGLTILRRCEPL